MRERARLFARHVRHELDAVEVLAGAALLTGGVAWYSGPAAAILAGILLIVDGSITRRRGRWGY